VDSTELAGLVRSSAAPIWYDAPPIDRDDTRRRLRFGAQLDARPITGTPAGTPMAASCTLRRSLPTLPSTRPRPLATYPATKTPGTGIYRDSEAARASWLDAPH
jgi:hypothetical protein